VRRWDDRGLTALLLEGRNVNLFGRRNNLNLFGRIEVQGHALAWL